MALPFLPRVPCAQDSRFRPPNRRRHLLHDDNRTSCSRRRRYAPAPAPPPSRPTICSAPNLSPHNRHLLPSNSSMQLVSASPPPPLSHSPPSSVSLEDAFAARLLNQQTAVLLGGVLTISSCRAFQKFRPGGIFRPRQASSSRVFRTVIRWRRTKQCSWPRQETLRSMHLETASSSPATG